MVVTDMTEAVGLVVAGAQLGILLAQLGLVLVCLCLGLLVCLVMCLCWWRS